MDIGIRIPRRLTREIVLYIGRSKFYILFINIDIYVEVLKHNSNFRQTTSDSIELSEASLDVNLSSCNLRCKVAAGTPPLNNLTFYERTSTQQVIILAATVSSVHRLIFPHPDVIDRKVRTCLFFVFEQFSLTFIGFNYNIILLQSTFGSICSVTPSIFHDTNTINNPNNYYILNQYSNTSKYTKFSESLLIFIRISDISIGFLFNKICIVA